MAKDPITEEEVLSSLTQRESVDTMRFKEDIGADVQRSIEMGRASATKRGVEVSPDFETKALRIGKKITGRQEMAKLKQVYQDVVNQKIKEAGALDEGEAARFRLALGRQNNQFSMELNKLIAGVDRKLKEGFRSQAEKMAFINGISRVVAGGAELVATAGMKNTRDSRGMDNASADDLQPADELEEPSGPSVGSVRGGQMATPGDEFS